MFLPDTKTMNRREFTHKATRWGLALGLVGISVILSKKVVLKRDCTSCPDYASCTGINECTTNSLAENNERQK